MSNEEYKVPEFPSNSKKTLEEVKKEKKVEKVIQGKVIQQKKTLGKKIAETFLGEEVLDVKAYVVHDVLIPTLKNTVVDMFRDIPEMIFFGERRGSRTTRERGRSYVSYDKVIDSRRSSIRTERRDISQRDRASHNFDDIILDSRGEAEMVLSNMVDLIIDYDVATVSDLYDFVGITSNYTDKKYGWDDLSSASVSRVRAGYKLNLPRTILID